MILDADGNPISSDRIDLKKLTFVELPRRLKVSFAVVAGLIAALALLVANIQTLKAAFTDPAPDLSLEDTTVSDDGLATRVDMFLLNKGDATALITRARVEVIDEIRMTDHMIGGAPLDAVVEYNVTLNLADPQNTISHVDNFAREVEPADADRISLHITTQDLGSDLLIAYKIRVVLTYNDSTELVSPPILIAGKMGFSAMYFYGDIPDEVKAQFPTLLQSLDLPDAQKGLAVSNIVIKLKELMQRKEG